PQLHSSSCHTPAAPRVGPSRGELSSSPCMASQRGVLLVYSPCLLTRTCVSTQVALTSPTQRPLDRLTFEQLRRVRPFAARVHLAARTHASPNQCESRADAAMTSQCIHQQPGGVAHDRGQLHKAALLVVPGQEHAHPVMDH